MYRVLVAEDSATARHLLVAILSADPDIEVVGQARDGAEALKLCTVLRPDVVTMDVQMPVMDGVEATRRIMAECATPVIMVSSLQPEDVKSSMNAFGAGAVAVLAKPAGPGTPRFEQDARALITTLKQVVEAKRESAAAPASEAEPPAAAVRAPTAPHDARPVLQPSPRSAASAGLTVVGLVAETGGPFALRTIFKALPATVKPPILIVQHIAVGFTRGFAAWLRESTQRDVKLAVHGERIATGGVYIAPDERHLTVDGDHLVVTEGPPIDGARPSGSALLGSLATHYGARALGAVLSGAGQDGVEGLRQLRDAGGEVFAQDEASCAVYGMPKTAVRAGIVMKGTPLSAITAQVVTASARGTVK